MEYALIPVVEDISFAEGLRWHEGALWFSDMGAGQVIRYVEGSPPQVVVDGLPRASGLGWTEDGALLVSSIAANTVLRLDDAGALVPVVEPGSHGGIGTNDMVTFGSRSYVGHSGRHYQEGDEYRTDLDRVGGIVLIDHVARTGRPVANGMGLPNGMVITPDGRRLFVADTYLKELIEFQITPNGDLVDRRLLASLEDGPDGIALDAELGIWASCPMGSVYRRIGSNGQVTDEISVPGWSAVACALGGPDGHTLFLAMAQFDSVASLVAGESRGRIVATSVAVPAAATPSS